VGEIADRMIRRKLWLTRGKTPAATIYVALLRDIKSFGAKSRFAKETRRANFSLS